VSEHVSQPCALLKARRREKNALPLSQHPTPTTPLVQHLLGVLWLFIIILKQFFRPIPLGQCTRGTLYLYMAGPSRVDYFCTTWLSTKRARVAKSFQATSSLRPGPIFLRCDAIPLREACDLPQLTLRRSLWLTRPRSTTATLSAMCPRSRTAIQASGSVFEESRRARPEQRRASRSPRGQAQLVVERRGTEKDEPIPHRDERFEAQKIPPVLDYRWYRKDLSIIKYESYRCDASE